jgi:hypothetical protein
MIHAVQAGELQKTGKQISEASGLLLPPFIMTISQDQRQEMKLPAGSHTTKHWISKLMSRAFLCSILEYQHS